MAADTTEGDEEVERHKAEFRRWVSDLEEQQLEADRGAALAAGRLWLCVRLVDAPLSNFPVAAWDVHEELSSGAQADQSGQDIEGLLSPSLWLQSLEQIARHGKEAGVPPCLAAFDPVFLQPVVQALETPGHLSVCQQGTALLPWLADRLEAGAADLASTAALALELLVASEAWPAIGLTPSACSESSELKPWDRLQLAAHLRGATPGAALPASAALALCQLCLTEGDALAAERCGFWANGLVASLPGWREVLSFVKSLGPATPLQPVSGKGWREAALAALAADRCGPLQALIAQGLAPSGGNVATPGEVFDVALTGFPKVLPWNLVDWMSWTFESTSSLRHRRDSLVQELLQYTMKLLPTCESRPGFAELLKAVLALALHRRPFEMLVPVPLRAGRCLLADALLRRYGAQHAQLCQELCRQLRYPLGVMLLLADAALFKEPAKDALEQIRDLLARSSRLT
ncbi:unnamed protein product [Symbiodinium natans]|uniref:Uncharacterized protein n=1 Tax=Symbiodinium natans TaxID=878477 RepID=A0A812IE38_9DINO|nr:unnamed protein product [Symbiodinium natans]